MKAALLPDTSTHLNNILRTVCAVLIVLVAIEMVYSFASMPLFYQRAITQTLPDFQIGGFIQVTNASTAAEAAIRGLSIPDYVSYRMAIDVLSGLVFYSVALLILYRARGQWFLWFTAVVLFFIPAGQLHHYVPLDRELTRYLMLNSLLWPAFPLFLYLFPNGRAVLGWMRWLIGPVLVAHLFAQGLAVLAMFTLGQVNLTSEITPYLPLVLLSFPLALTAQVYRYLRVSTREERLQTKWVIGGLVVAILGNVVISIVFQQVNIQADYGFSSDLSNLLILLIPITIGISILRYRLYDIDVIIRRTLQYGLLSVLLGLVYFGLVALLGQVFRGMTGQESPLVVVISTLAIAALFTPLRRRIQDAIDRRFFRKKYDAEQAMAAFAEAARSEVNLETLAARLVSAARESLEPENVSLWLKKTGG